MAELHIGKKNAVPVKNLKSEHWGDIVGEISNQTDLQEALDSKLDKTDVPLSLYGTDANGNQTLYDASYIFSSESLPQGYTNVEYITSSSKEYSYEVTDVESETGYLTPSIQNTTAFDHTLDSYTTQQGYTVDRLKITCTDEQTGNCSVYCNNEDHTDYVLLSTDILESSLRTNYGILFSYSQPSSGRVGDSAVFTRIENEYGQYIDTGITIANFPYGYAAINAEESNYQNENVSPSGSIIHASATQSTINNMSSKYGRSITKMKFVYSSTDHMDLYPGDDESAERYAWYNNFGAVESNCGIYFNWQNLTVGDIFYFDYIPKQIDTYSVETSLKLSEYSLSQTPNYILGSISQSGSHGCGIMCSEDDAVMGFDYRHYTVNTQWNLKIPYNKGSWNNIVVEPGVFTLNGNSYEFSTTDDVRTVFNKTFLLFGISREDGAYTSGLSLKKTKIYKNNELVFCGIPCIENTTNIAGMYDLVSNTFFKSAKTGVEFIAGPIETENKITFGVNGSNALIGLDRDGNVSTYKSKNGIVIESLVGLDDYEELEYIESTAGNLAFDTQRAWGSTSGGLFSNTKWEITYYQTYRSVQDGGKVCQYVFGDGCFYNMGQSFNRIDFRFYDGQGSFCYTSTSGNVGANSADGIFMEELETWNTFAFDYKKLYLNNSVIKNLNYPIALNSHDRNFHIFTAPNAVVAGDFGDGFIGRISNVRELSDGVMISNFIPVRRKSDHEIGFYDTINGVFCQNIGKGTPVAGPIKYSTISLSKNLDDLLENVALQKETSLMITTPTVPGSNTLKNRDGSGNVIIGPYGEIDQNKHGSIAINGKAKESNSVSIGKDTTVYGAQAIGIGVGVSGESDIRCQVGLQCVAIGYNSQCNGGFGNIAIGYNSSMNNAAYSVSLGYKARSISGYNIAEGFYARSFGVNSIAIGAQSYASTDGVAIGGNYQNNSSGSYANNKCVAIGSRSQARGERTVVLGYNANANALNGTIVIGANSSSTSPVSIVIGNGATAAASNTNGYAIVIGQDAFANNGHSIALGSNSNATGMFSTSIGSNSEARSERSIAIGLHATVENGSEHSIAIGSGATVNNTSGSDLYNISLGTESISDRGDSIAIGHGAQATGLGAIAIGYNAKSPNIGTSVVIGYNAQATGGWGVAIGQNAMASESSVALGRGAQATDARNVQLGTGTNGERGTLQFRDYKLVDADGHIPTQRLSSMTPINGYVLAYDADTESLVWVENGKGGSYTLPVASQSTLGGIKVGNGLSITEDGVLSATGGSGEGGNGVWGEITGTLSDQTDLQNALDEKQEVFQVQSLPTASEELNGKVRQYMGITNIMYTHGYMYECQYKRVPTFTINEQSTSAHISLNAERFKQYVLVYQDVEVPTSQIEVRFDGTNWLVTNMDSGYNYGSYSTYNLQYLGISIEYSGSASPEVDDYVILNYNAEGEFKHTWTNITTQPLVEVINSLSSESTTNALSAKQGKVLNERIDTLASIGQFLAIWDADTHNARYLESGYTYQTGNYFIVGSVSETTNYKPKGGLYNLSGDYYEETTDDVQVSDMYFYDGQNWVLLANHGRQIAVDQALDPASTNPVENQVITNALNNKVSTTSDSNRVYGTTALGEQIALELGNGFVNENGVLSVDVSGKQDTLVSGENIKTINGESILGSGDIVIKGGSGGEGIGTLNVANAFITSADIICDEDRPDDYKGNYHHIMITTNGDKDYLLDHMNDFYITTLRRNKLHGVRKFRSLNDRRIPTNIHLHCWRVPTYKYWDYDLRVFSEYELGQRNSMYMSDADYVYFYTIEDFNSVNDLINSNPSVLVSDLRHDDETTTQDENITQGNWGTCLNLMNNVSAEGNTLNVRYFTENYNNNIERCERYDIDKIVNLTNNEIGESIIYYEGNEVFKKMRGRLYKNTNGDKVYLWSNGWEKTNNPVFACLDEKNEPVVNYVPLDRRDISQWCSYDQFIEIGWELVERRVDLDWFYFDYDLGYYSYDVILNVRRISTQKEGHDYDSNYYLLDNSIQPVRLAECKIYMKELPYVYVDMELGEESPYLPYWHKAYTWYEIKDNEELMHMLNSQKEIIFVLPHDTYNLWMRTFKWERYVYHHMEQDVSYLDNQTPFNAPTYEAIYRGDGTYYHEWDGGYVEQPLVAHPTERHNLRAGLETTYARRDRKFKNNYSSDVFWGGFENDLANRLGDRHKKFNWDMRDDNSMWLPIAFSIATGHEVGMDCIGKETPVERTMTINGRCYQGLI